MTDQTVARSNGSSGADTLPDDSLLRKACERAVRGPIRRVLLVTTVFQLPYRVMRCAQRCGAEVYVLGNRGARPLRYSRHCRGFVPSHCRIDGEREEALAVEIRDLVRRWDIDMVLPGDAQSTRSLIVSRDLIQVPCFPLPDLQTFDRLNDKWSFAALCQELGIRIPTTQLLQSRAAAEQAIEAGQLSYPLVVKPLSQSGGEGIVVLKGPNDRDLEAIDYQPLLLQQYIDGTPVSSTIYARAGKIEAFVAHWYHRRVYATFRDDHIYCEVAKIVRHLNLEGTYNFDMMSGRDGTIYFLECNPRFSYRLALTMIAGINFVQCGFDEPYRGPAFIADGALVRSPRALLRPPFAWSGITQRDWAMAAYQYLDPLPYLTEKIKRLAKSTV